MAKHGASGQLGRFYLGHTPYRTLFPNTSPNQHKLMVMCQRPTNQAKRPPLLPLAIAPHCFASVLNSARPVRFRIPHTINTIKKQGPFPDLY